MSKNLARLQGVILGTVVGFLLYTLLASTCWRTFLGVQIPVGFVGLGCVLFFFVWTTFFFYMNSKTNAYMAFLLMYNATMQMIVGCDAENPQVFLRPIVLDVMITIIVMTVVDAWFERHKASTLANHQIVEAFQIINKQTVHLFDSEKHASPIGGGKLASCLAKACAYGDFAVEEARWHRTPWRKETFYLALNTARQLRYLLHGMHTVAHVHGNNIAESRKDFKSKPLCESLRMEAVQKHLLHQPERRLAHVIQLLSILEHDKEGPCLEFEESQYQVNKEFRHYHNETLTLALAEAEEKTIIGCFEKDGERDIRREDLRAAQATSKSLELDHVAQISYELAAGRTMVRMVRELMNSIIRLG